MRRLPPRFQRLLESLLAQWPGRVGIRILAVSIRIELFDRSMTIAAQFFTSVLPILIIAASLVAGDGTQIADAFSVPEETQEVLDEALGSGPDSTTFGIVGVIIVLASATSLSRALTRAFAAIWGLPRPHARLTSAWRWVAVVLALAMALVMTRALGRYLDDVPPPTLWEALATVSFDVIIGVFIPWILLNGRIPLRQLLAGAVLFGLTMLLVRPASGAWLPRALEVSADRYGAIGVAFTYLAWLYVVSFCFLTASLVGQVLTTDRGRLGEVLRGGVPPAGT